MMATHPIGLKALRHIGLRTTAYEESLDFYGGMWGLERLPGEDLDRALFRGSGIEHHLLELRRSDANAIDHIAFAVGTPAAVDAAAERLEKDGVRIVEDPRRVTDADKGYRLRFADHEGRTLEISAEASAVAPRPADRPVPIKLAHVVLNTVDIDAAVEFYTEVLGFKVTDWSEHQMAFLRCNRDHHSIAFNQADYASLNHVAYEMTSVDNYMKGIGRLKAHGVEPLWGPGRHGPGNNTFAYFADPAGLVPEYTSEVERIDEAEWLPRVWQRVPDQSDLWGTAGPPSPTVRKHMAGSPDAGIGPEAVRRYAD